MVTNFAKRPHNVSGMTIRKVGLVVFVTFVVVLVLVPQVKSLSCFSCYSVNGSDRRCDDPMIRMYTGIIDPVECTLPTVTDDDENVTVLSEEQGPKYESKLEAPETEAPLKPWSMRSTYCVKMIGISGKSTVFENHRKSLIQYCERSELRLHFEWTKVH